MSNPAWRLAEIGRKAVQEAVEKHQEQNPDALPFKALARVVVVRKKPKGFESVPLEMVENFLTSKAYLNLTNQQLIEQLAHKWSPFPISAGFMDKPLSARQLGRIGNRLSKVGIYFDPLRHKSLSKIKRAIQAGKKAEDAVRKVAAEVTFGSDFVTVAGKQFAVSKDAKGYRRIKVGDQKLRVDVLEALFDISGSPSSTS